jgi:hypothetical protein
MVNIYKFYVCNSMNDCKLCVICDFLPDEWIGCPFGVSFYTDLYVENSGNNI